MQEEALNPHPSRRELPSPPPSPAPARADLGGAAKGGMRGAAALDDVSDERLLAVVGGEDADLGGGVPQQPHVLVQRHQVLRLAQVLHRGWGRGDGQEAGMLVR